MHALAAKFLGLAVILVLMTIVWADSVRRKDASVVDRWWGALFVVLGVLYASVSDGPVGRRVLLAVLVTVWGLRLAGYITWRNSGEPEDKRYQAMRAKNPETFAKRSLFSIFWLQGVLAWTISAPLFYPHFLTGARELYWLDFVGVAVWLIGFAFEAGGDFQLQRFLADPANKGKVMDKGFWRYTRHPNYFGDVAVWVGYAIIATAAGAWWAWYGTILMALFIIKVSGVALTDRNMAASSSTREGYDEYVRRTNAFLPWFPKGAE
ncbi:MAG: steroid 5-alpha reductase family enzyme [Glaciecola sp.]|jgi:steroid 5-alpha reductase family enzyme